MMCMQESFHYMKYKKAENIIYEYADDVAPRYVTSALQLDYDTMCGADKFGNIFMTRLPSDISAQVPLLSLTARSLLMSKFANPADQDGLCFIAFELSPGLE